MSVLDEIRALMGETPLPATAPATVEAFGVDTGKVLVMPSGVTRDLAAQAIADIDTSPIMRDIGVIVARQIATELQQMALRPADYASLPDLPQMVAARLGAELATAPDVFVASLLEQLRLKG